MPNYERAQRAHKPEAEQDTTQEQQVGSYEQQAEELYHQFKQFLQDTGLFDSPDLTTFLAVFHQHFRKFQAHAANKLNVEAFKRGEISCTGASILAAIWWQEKTGTQPIYVLDTESKYFLGHFILMLPHTQLQPDQVAQTWDEYNAGLPTPHCTFIEFRDIEEFVVVPPGECYLSAPAFYFSTPEVICTRLRLIDEHLAALEQRKKALQQYLA